MTDLFDIANIITTVGVDAVKIKPEPGLPEKSSNEILTELFSTFDADDETDSSNDSSNDNEKPIHTKKKKSKKKHKHKDKKHKKKSKHNSEEDSDTENGNKKKKKHKKKSKRKHESKKSQDEDESKVKILKLEPLDSTKNNIEGTNNLDGSLKTWEKERSPKGPLLPPTSKAVTIDPEELLTTKLLDKTKQPIPGKIQIKDLKNSIVFNETVKKVKDQERAKAARMEDGELTDSSDNRTPTLSPTPPLSNSFRSPSTSPTSGRNNSKQKKNDLRQVLKDKEKKRFEETTSDNKVHDEKDKKTYKDVEHKNCKSKNNKHMDGKGSDSKSHTSSRRSKSRDKDRHRGRSRDRSERRDSTRSRDRKRFRSRSNDRGKDKYSRGRSRSRDRKERIEIDKKKLLEIARKNAISMIKQGTLPLAQQDKAIAAIQAGGKTVDELTDFCKSLSKSEALGELSSISSDDDGSESEKGFHHPFLLKERPSSIIMNIKDAKQLPTKTFQEKTTESSNQLRLQFPVSSGQLHRKTESEWVPVPLKKPEPKKQFVPAEVPQEPPPPPPPVIVPVTPVPVAIQPGIFPQPHMLQPMDIGSIVSQRLAAMRKLRENPHDVCALNEMYRAQNEMKSWAESKQMPGQFTGSTGVKVLTPAELTSGYQAWARKDQLLSAQPVSGGMGMALLQKMGWRPGEGLGKNKEGTLEPLQLEVKLDKRGLVSEQDVTQHQQKVGKPLKPIIPAVKTLEGKHPVSLLGEYCSKRKFGAPVYELCFECGPDHRKNFLFKVRVNGIEYQPSIASPNKKQAKAEAAQICLQTLGLLPS